MKMLEALTNIFKGKPKISSLEEYRIQQGYLKERIENAEKKGQSKAKTEVKQEEKQEKEVIKTKKGKSQWDSFRDFATRFANSPPMENTLMLGGKDGKKSKRNSKGSWSRYRDWY